MRVLLEKTKKNGVRKEKEENRSNESMIINWIWNFVSDIVRCLTISNDIS